MISVIIPTYNRCDFIEQAVRSILNQTYPCAEVIIIDDGSTDGTGDLVQEIAEIATIPVRYHYQQNKGAAAARNSGIRKASCELLCFLDSDDYFLPDKLKQQKKVFDASDCLISHTDEKWLRRGKHLNKKKKHQSPDGYIFESCLPMCVVGLSTVMVRRELFERYGMFDETFPCCEDYDLWLRVSASERFTLVPEPLTVKNGGRDDQLSVVYREGMDKYRIHALVNLLQNISLDREQYNAAVRELKRKCEIYGKGCLKHGRADEGHIYLNIPDKYGQN